MENVKEALFMFASNDGNVNPTIRFRTTNYREFFGPIVQRLPRDVANAIVEKEQTI